MADRLSNTPRPTRFNYYDPPVNIRLVPGLVKDEPREPDYFDYYSGSGEVLVAAGLVTSDQLPGYPGRPSTSITYRPRGVQGAQGQWREVPGYMTIRRTPKGYSVALVVSEEEQDRRWAARQARRGAAHRGDPDRLFAAPIIEHGAFNSLNRNHAVEGLRDVQTRRRLIEQVNAEGPPSVEEAWAIERLRKAVSELDAYDVIQRVRMGARRPGG